MPREIGSEKLDGLVRTYLDLVYAAAVRQLGGDLSGAEDVAQAVMIVLMRKGRAGKLPEEKYMTGWLLRVTRYAVMAARRTDLRRAIHEGKAAVTEERDADNNARAEAAEVRLLLDEALLKLARLDREVVMRRYLQGQSVAAVAAAVGMNENSVGRRIARALEKLQKMLARRGVMTPAAAIVGVMGTEALVKAPSAIAATVASGTATSGLASGIAKAIFWRLIMTKVAAGLVVGATVLALGTVAALQVKTFSQAKADTPAAKAPFNVAKETTAVTAPLRPDGTVDYVAALNEKYSRGVTPENNGFVVWTKVMGTKGAASLWDAMAATGNIGERPTEPGWTSYRNPRELTILQSHPWKADDHPQFAAFLKDREQLLALAEQASHKERWWEPATSKNGSMTWILLPELSSLKDVARTLAARAMLRAGQGDFDGFLRDVMTVKRLARLASDWATINAIVMQTMDGYANQAIGGAAGAGIFSRDQCAKLATALDNLQPLTPMREVIAVGERWDNLDFAASLATGKLDSWLGTGNTEYEEGIREFAAVDRDAVDWNVVLKRVNAMFDEIEGILKTPDIEKAVIGAQAFEKKANDLVGNQRIPDALAKQPGETNDAYSERVAETTVAQRTSAFWNAEAAYGGAVIRGDLARTVVAVAQYRADHSKWPENLQALTPAYLKALPRDPFSRNGAPVIYTVSPDGVQIYSVGLNGVDEQGLNNGKNRGPDDISIGVAGPDEAMP